VQIYRVTECIYIGFCCKKFDKLREIYWHYSNLHEVICVMKYAPFFSVTWYKESVLKSINLCSVQATRSPRNEEWVLWLLFLQQCITGSHSCINTLWCLTCAHCWLGCSSWTSDTADVLQWSSVSWISSSVYYTYCFLPFLVTNILKGHIALIYRSSSPWRLKHNYLTLKTKAMWFFEIQVKFYQSTCKNIPEDFHLSNTAEWISDHGV